MITGRNGMKEFRRQGFLAGSVSDLPSNGWTGKLWRPVPPVPLQPPSCVPALTGREVEVSLAVTCHPAGRAWLVLSVLSFRGTTVRLCMITVRNGMKEFRRQGFLAGSVSDLPSNGWTGKLWRPVPWVPLQPPSRLPALARISHAGEVHRGSE